MSRRVTPDGRLYRRGAEVLQRLERLRPKPPRTAGRPTRSVDRIACVRHSPATGGIRSHVVPSAENQATLVRLGRAAYPIATTPGVPDATSNMPTSGPLIVM
jgi:hypothetical protein